MKAWAMALKSRWISSPCQSAPPSSLAVSPCTSGQTCIHFPGARPAMTYCQLQPLCGFAPGAQPTRTPPHHHASIVSYMWFQSHVHSTSMSLTVLLGVRFTHIRLHNSLLREGFYHLR